MLISDWINFGINFEVNFNENVYRNNSPASNYMFKVNNRNTRTRCEICSKLTIKTPEDAIGVVFVSV